MKNQTDEEPKIDVQVYTDSIFNRKNHIANMLNFN